MSKSNQLFHELVVQAFQGLKLGMNASLFAFVLCSPNMELFLVPIFVIPFPEPFTPKKINGRCCLLHGTLGTQKPNTSGIMVRHFGNF